MHEEVGALAIEAAIRESDGPAICAYLTAGYPTVDEFPEVLHSVAHAADVVELGVPFTDPMADGLTIQEASRVALDNGVSLDSILEMLQDTELAAPHLLMGYYNPFLAFGLDRLGPALETTKTSGLIIPDLPLEESERVSAVLEPRGLALVQLVSPATSPDRLGRVAKASRGFVYAVTSTGTTGGSVSLPAETLEYLDSVRQVSDLPVMAGFGVREPAQIAALAPHVDGVVVGSALIEAIGRGDDPGAFISGLRPVTAGRRDFFP